MKNNKSCAERSKNVWANLGVKDLNITHDFYQQLGFKLNGEFPNEHELVSFKVGANDFIVHFFQNEKLKKALEGEVANLKNGNEIMFTLSADTKEDVDFWAQEVKKAGGNVFSKPQKIQGNDHWYGCAFADPDGHKWNVFFSGNIK